MTNFKLRSLDLIQVDGGLSTKQGDTWSRIAYQLVDENEESIRITDATSVAVYLKNENGLYQLDGILEGDEVGFYLTPQVVNGSYQVEIQIKHETGRISKFPSTNTVTLKIVKSLVNQESLTISIIDTYKNNNLPKDPETGEKVLVAGDNSIGWYRDHAGTREIVLTTNASDPLKLYSDFPEKRPFEPDNSANHDHHQSSFVDIYSDDIRSGGYIHEKRNHNGHFINVSVGGFMIEEPRVLSIPITDMSTGSSATFDIKVYPYNWYDPETKLIRNPSVNTEETGVNNDDQPLIDNSHVVSPPIEIVTPPSNEFDTSSPKEEDTVTQPVIDKAELIRLEEEKLKAEGYTIFKHKYTGGKEYRSADMMENITLDVRDGVVIRGDLIPSVDEDYEQIWPEVVKKVPRVSDANDLMTTIDSSNPAYEEVRSLDTEGAMLSDPQFLYIIRDEDISELTGPEFAGDIYIKEYSFNMFKEYLENGIKLDPDGLKYPIFYLVAEYDGNKYYLKGA